MGIRLLLMAAASVCLGSCIVATPAGYADETESECARGQPERLVRGSHFEAFGTHEATELVVVDDATQVAIRHYGCAHYAQKFTFLVGRVEHPAANVAYWHERTAELLSALGQVSLESGQLNAMAAAIRDAAPAGRYGEPLGVSEVETLTLHAADLPDDVVALIVSFDVTL